MLCSTLKENLDMKTGTCVHTPGYPPMVRHGISQTNLLSAIDGARIVYFDGRLYETTFVVAQEVMHQAFF